MNHFTVSGQLRPSLVDKVIDTAGADDAYRAGVMGGLITGMDDVRTLRYACAVAAEVVQTSPGVLGFRAHRFSG